MISERVLFGFSMEGIDGGVVGELCEESGRWGFLWWCLCGVACPRRG
jgi:hypothetical protein